MQTQTPLAARKQASPAQQHPAERPAASGQVAAAEQPQDATGVAHTLQTQQASIDCKSQHQAAAASPDCVSQTLPVASSAKRKRSSKAEQLPSLQDAPGVPEKLGDVPLRLIIVGHNPSDHAW